jgi:hypothetical protein
MNAGNVHGNWVVEAGGLNEFGVKAVNVVHYHYLGLELIYLLFYAFFKNAKKDFNFRRAKPPYDPLKGYKNKNL